MKPAIFLIVTFLTLTSSSVLQAQTVYVGLQTGLDISAGASASYSISKNFDVRLLYNHSVARSSNFYWFDNTGSGVGISKQYYQYIQLGLRFKQA